MLVAVVKTKSTIALQKARLGFFLCSLVFFLLCVAGRDLPTLATGQQMVPIPTTTKTWPSYFIP
jgi:hypothetical protein